MTEPTPRCRVCLNPCPTDLLAVDDRTTGARSYLCRQPSSCWYSSIRDADHEAIALLVPLTAAERAGFLAFVDERRRRSDAAKAAAA